jgi:hypothetical protein
METLVGNKQLGKHKIPEVARGIPPLFSGIVHSARLQVE